ncbi:MAG: MMPL family transporter [Flammeovirgaceae bacterium]
MGYQATKARMSYEFTKIVPENDPDMIFYQNLKKTFGDDANALALGIKDSALYQIKNFEEFRKLGESIKKVEGAKEVVSLANLQYLLKDTTNKKFIITSLFEKTPQSQSELDSILNFASQIKFFENKILNPNNGATLMIVSLDQKLIQSEKRIEIVENIRKKAFEFTKKTNIEVHFTGLPYIRTIISSMVKKELNEFLILSLVVTAIVMFLFFRNITPVFYSLLIIGIVIVWTIGCLGLFEYKITALSGLLPPIMTVIGIPNCIYMINKYQQEYLHYYQKEKAIISMVKKIGIVTLMTNSTTAIGFIVLLMTNVDIMQEFGIVASINIMALYVISIIFIPALLSYLPAPSEKSVKHLSSKGILWILLKLEWIVVYKRKLVYTIVILLVGISYYGMTQIKANSYMLDDVPEDNHVKKDLIFFEENFKGVMPLEIVVDTGKEKGIRKRSNLEKVEELEERLSRVPNITPTVSMVDFLKAANQAYFGNSPSDYRLPSKREELFIYNYLKNNQKEDSINVFKNLVDSTGRYLRVSMKVADLGSLRMDTLLKKHIQPAIDCTFVNTELNAKATGSTLLFIKGNDFLITNLKQSMILAFVLIALIIGSLFRNVRIVIISLIPNLIPLIFTAGFMGFFDIPLKPSTALIFSITFGIAVDDSIHYLAKYYQDLIKCKFDVEKSVRMSLKETGASMMYTSIVLFFGFVIFAASNFGGTVALGVLTSITLLIAMFINLIVLPSLLLTFDKPNPREIKEEQELLKDFE